MVCTTSAKFLALFSILVLSKDAAAGRRASGSAVERWRESRANLPANAHLHRRVAQTSPTPCATLRDASGYCCKAGDDLTDTKDDGECCTSNVYTYVCPSVGTITACCDGGTIYDEEANIGQGCCQPPSVVDEDGNCVSPQVRYKRRAYPGDMPLEDPLRVASWREGSDRLNLSPRMVADMLLNNFEIEWQGQRFRAFEMQHNNAKRWEILLRRGISTVAKYTTGHLLSRHIRELHETGQTHLSLGREFEMKVDDIPDVYAALLSHEKWNGGVSIEGALWDKDTFYSIISQHPNWNATVHDVV